METKPVRVNFKSLSSPDLNRFAMQQVLVETGVDYEYSNQGQWLLGQPTFKPDGKRAIFTDIETFRVARGVYFQWKEFDSVKSFDPVRPDEIIRRLLSARISRRPLNLFVPWGIRTQGTPNLECDVLDKLSVIRKSLEQKSIPTSVLIMPADIYATEINNWSSSETANYVRTIADEAVQRNFVVQSWSEIRARNRAQYEKRVKKLALGALEKLLPGYISWGAVKAARRRSNFASVDETKLASINYLRERICEAEIIEEEFKPIKISLVSKNKDNEVDCDLPRLYIFPGELQFPWLS